MSPDTDHQPNRDLDTTILTAAAELRAQVVGGEPSTFTPSPRRAPVAGALACVLVLLGGFALFRGGDDGPGDRTVAGPASTESGPAPLTDESGAGILDLAVLVSSPEPLVQAPLERPAAGESVVDPAFGTTITRITDAGSGESIVPIPSGQSAWNADESLLLLYRQGSGFELRDGRTGSPVADLDINPADIEEIYWSPTDPALLTYVDGVELVAFDVNSSTRQILHTFDGCADVHSNGPVPPSADGQLWGLLCIDDTGAVSPVAYRLGDGIDHRMAAEADAAVAPIPTRSGLGLLVSRPGRGLDLYDPTLTDVIGSFPLIEDANVIAAVDGDGAEVIVSTAFNSGPTGVGAAVAHPLDGSDPWPVVGEQTGHGTPPSGTHFASGGLGTSERFAITNRAVPQDGQPGVVDGEILLVDLSGPEPTIVRLAHHRTLGGDYFSYPFVSLSPQGDRLLFSSDWGGDHVDTYLVDIPTK